MRLSDELKVGVLGLLALQAVTSASAIALLTRMSPAIDRILTQNLASILAGAEMLAALAELPRDPAGEAARQERFEEALALAGSNVTEAEEGPILAAIGSSATAALAGAPDERRRTVRAIDKLIEVNHASTREADLEARRLGAAGAWAAVLLGAIGLGVCVLGVRRLVRRLIHPLLDLAETIAAFQRGERHRRTNRHGMPVELAEIAGAVDDLIDRAIAPAGLPPPGTSPAAERAAVLLLLDRLPAPALMLDSAGRPLAAGQAALDRLNAEDGQTLRAALEELPLRGDDQLPAGWKRTPLGGGAWLVELGPTPHEPA